MFNKNEVLDFLYNCIDVFNSYGTSHQIINCQLLVN